MQINLPKAHFHFLLFSSAHLRIERDRNKKGKGKQALVPSQISIFSEALSAVRPMPGALGVHSAQGEGELCEVQCFCVCHTCPASWKVMN